jgi:phosphatidylglycerol:prolipoprotein diacylglycerol transferase
MVHINIDPILFHWGPVTLGWHGLWLAAGLFVAYRVFVHQGQKRGIDKDNLGELAFWILVIGYVGARLLHVLSHWQAYASQPAEILAIREGGLKLYGALVGATIVIAVYVRYRRLSFWSVADAMAVAIPAAEIVGRIGCTLNGDVWGMATGGSWGLVYWHPGASIPSYLLGVPTVPTPTMLQAWNAALLLLLLMLQRRLRPPGLLFAICMVGYSLGRFVISIWQPQPRLLLGLKQTQAISLVLIGLGVLLLLYLRARPSSPTEPAESRSR